MLPTAEEFIAELKEPLQGLALAIHRELVELGCSTYVKTIYVGYQIGDDMVAALYPHAQSIEVALALPEDHPDMALHDATHLTWPTMPLSATIADLDRLPWLIEYLRDAAQRVANGAHAVRRPPDYFMGRKTRPPAR